MISDIDYLLGLDPFGVPPEMKAPLFANALSQSIRHHYQYCPLYRRWLDLQRFDVDLPIGEISKVPYLPAPLFKEISLITGSDEDIVRVLTSSATSSGIPSRVSIDGITRSRQMKALAAVMSDLIGRKRRPFILLDAAPQNRNMMDRELSARIAGLRGYLMAASDQVHVMNQEGSALKLDLEYLNEMIDHFQTAGQPICLLGYTYVLYQYVIKPLYEQEISLELPDSTFILHFGGWKRLQDQAVSREMLVERASAVFRLSAQSILDLFGFTEQLGVVYPDDGTGIKRAPVFAEVLVRDVETLEVVPDGQTGLLQFLTPLPNSYPGVALLLDDVGRIVSREPSPTGRHGVGFEVLGRAEGVEIRGCGDTLPDRVYEVTS